MWRVPVAEDGLEQPWLGPRQGERDRLEHLERLARKDRRRVRGRRRAPSAARRPHRRASTCGDEERVPARARIQVGGVDLVSDRQLTDGGGRERSEREPVDGRRRGEVAEQHAHRVVAVEAVVAIGADDERRDVHPAAEQPQDVERRLVAPVQVLDHEHGRLLCELVAQHREHLRRLDGRTEDVRERVALRGHVEQRPERAGRRERVTGAREHASVRLEPCAEGTDERGLAGAGLAADEDDPS